MKKVSENKKQNSDNKKVVKTKKEVLKPKKEKKVMTAQEKRESRTSFMFDKHHYDDMKRYNDINGIEYKLVRTGTTEYMEMDGKKYRFRNDDVARKGFHITNMVKKDVSEYIKNNPDFYRRKKDYIEFFFNEVALKKHTGKYLISIDIKNCYWTTIYKLGYITKLTYYKALERSEWKQGRNASVGSLSKRGVVTTMKDNMIIHKENILPDKDFSDIRHNIIGYVYDLFLEIYNKIGNGFVMCLSDCIIADFKYKDKILNIIKSKGYDYKMESVFLSDFDYRMQYIQWVKGEEPKRYKYNQRQIIKPLKKVKKIEI